MNRRGAATAGRARAPPCTSSPSLVCSRQVKERWVKGPGQPTARTAQMEFNYLPLEVGYKRGFNYTSLNQRAGWLHSVSREKKGEKAVENFRENRMGEKGYSSREEDVGEMRPTGRKASLLFIQCLNLGYPKVSLLSLWSNNYSSLGTLISSAGPQWQTQN